MAEKSVTEKHLLYRGRLAGIVSLGSSVAFVTKPAESRGGAVYRLPGATLELSETPLPAGGQAIVADGETVFIAGTDGRIHESAGKGPALRTLEVSLDPPATGLAVLSNGRLAALSGATVQIIDRATGRLRQTLDLPEEGTALAADPSGQWLAVGSQKGNVAVFEGEDKDEFLLSETAKLHDGRVTAMLFEPEELRFLSAGADLKLLLTHARGRLEAEDRGRGGMHADAVTAIVAAPGERFLTGSRDGSCKNWIRGERTRPSTQTDGLVPIVGLATLEIHGRTHWVAACHDDSLRLFLLDAAGKFGPATCRVHGALTTSRHELNQADARRREAALRQLAEWGDGPSIDLLSEWAMNPAEADAGTRRLAARLVAESEHPKSAKCLEALLNHPDDAVRRIAFDGLLRRHGPHEFDLIDQALQLPHQNIGIAAVEALKTSAASDDRAHARLVKALEHAQREVAQAALLALEDVHGERPEGDLLGLASRKHGAVRRLACIRLLQRQLLAEPRVLSAVRRQLEANDADVRHTALQVLILSRPALAAALRERDADLNRQLQELESFDHASQASSKTDEAAGGTAAGKKSGARKASTKSAKRRVELTADDLEPLLQATASRALDICISGARCLALLKDSRALGLLLQLSRDEDAAARIAVCRGLSELGDARGVPRLESLLFDPAETVRDAAFSALAALHAERPLAACAAGLASNHEDVHRRALELLVRGLRKSSSEDAEAGAELLQRALNDPFPAVRKEALKSALSLGMGGADGGTLRFLLKSAYADVRKEALTEAMAQFRQPWAWTLLLELFNDPDAALRAEAFEFTLKETKRKDLKPMEAALRSQHADLRKQAIAELGQRRQPEALDLISTAIHDEDRETRLAALEAVFDAGDRDAVVGALDSRHADIRLAAAISLARAGNEESFGPLVELVQGEPPVKGDPRTDLWRKSVAQALDGLSDLGDPRAIPVAVPFLASEFAELRKEAGNALAWCAREEHGDLLCETLKHQDPAVRAEAALGAALQGRMEAKPFLLSPDFRARIGAGLELIGLAMLGPAGESEMVRLLDHDDERLRQAALLFLLFREWKSHDGTPRRLIACLSSLMPRVRLAAAEALRKFTEEAAFAALVARQFNDRGDKEPWKVPDETVETIASLMQFAIPWIRARIACFIGEWKAEKQEPFDAWWRRTSRRFAAEIERVQAVARKAKPPKPGVSQNDLNPLAFGTYIGLVREQGSAHAKKQQASLGPAVVRIRQTAIHRLAEMAEGDAEYRAGAVPVLAHALSDPNKDVRTAAFEALRRLQWDETRLASEAMETGYEDLGAAGLGLLTASGSAEEGRDLLEGVMRSRADALALRAAELLRERGDPVATAAAALEALNDRLRKQAVAWLAADAGDAARAALRGALDSRFSEIREAAAIELARKKETAAFETLVELLNRATNEAQQTRLITAISDLGDPRGPFALLDRSEHDPTGTARHTFLLQTVGRFRLPATADRLLKLLEMKERRAAALEALLRVSGFDQPIEDPDDERADASWQEKQSPRRDDLLARLMDKLLNLGEIASCRALIPAARWAKSDAVNAVLTTLSSASEEETRDAAVEAAGWRFRKRNGPVEPLLKALEHKSPTTRFLAAEALALGKRAEGLSTLLAAVELVDDLTLRERAVVALGELADPRALDLLLRLAGEEAHALQGEAAEAIGHLGRSDKAEAIFPLLERFAHGDTTVALFAIRGLRWFNTEKGWQLVRDRAVQGIPAVQSVAFLALGNNDTPATRALLLQAIAHQGPFGSFWFTPAALDSARRLFGPDSLEPDYALLKSPASSADGELDAQALKRVSRAPDAARLFEILETCSDSIASRLAELLLQGEASLDVATKALESVHVRQVAVAAHLLGRAGPGEAAVASLLEAALQRWHGKLKRRRDALSDADLAQDEEFHALQRCVERLMFAAGRWRIAPSALVATLRHRPNDRAFRALRRAAISALGEMPADRSIRDAMAELLTDADSAVRQRAAGILGHAAEPPARLATDLLSDRVGFQRLASAGVDGVAAAVHDGLASAHAQGVVLPWAVSSSDAARLAQVAADSALPDAVRLGAIEGLGRLATLAAERRLAEFGGQTEWDEELRKAAWRALRRSKRRREETKA